MSREGKCVSLLNVAPQEGPNSFGALLKGPDDRIRRDVFLLLDPKETDSEALQVGYTVVYPGCSTRGHTHPELEEVYFYVEGRGKMVVGEREFPVQAGDVVYVPFGAYHSTINPHSLPLGFYWITIKGEVASREEVSR